MMRPEDEALMQSFIDSKAGMCSGCELNMCRSDLKEFLEWLGDTRKLLYDATPDDIEQFILRIHAINRFTIATMERKLLAIRGFYVWLFNTGRHRSNPASGITIGEIFPRAKARRKCSKPKQA